MANANDSLVSTNSRTKMPHFSLQFLCSLIPKTFDGKRNEFNDFGTNCENAMLLSNDTKKSLACFHNFKINWQCPIAIYKAKLTMTGQN